MQAQRWEKPGSAVVEEPPTPPPKPASFERSSRGSVVAEQDGQSSAGTTLAERPRSVDHAARDDEEEDEEGSEKEGSVQANGSNGGESNSGSINVESETTKEEDEAVAEEDGKFDEVAL